jgi:Domain of unknown function (DUF4365)
MKPKRASFLEGQSAPYPERSPSEAHSKHTLMSLLDSRFVRGDLRIMDKYPNADGILDITDVNGYIKGKIDVQLKTLPSKRVNRPSHACEKNFLSYCAQSTLPVILIAVDQVNGKAYWQHMNYEILSVIQDKIVGKTYSLNLPLENCINGISLTYVDKWTQICKATFERGWNYDNLKAGYENLESELKVLREKFGPLTLNGEQVKQIQQFLDTYNYLLDHDFKIIKQVRYSNYWKIGLGIIRYTEDECSYLVYPIPYGTNEPLIRQVKPGSIKDIGREFVFGRILRTQAYANGNPISDAPEKLAYELIKADFEYGIKRIEFDLPDDFMANEYIHGFVSRFSTYLDLDGNSESFDLNELYELINTVLPLLLDIQLSIPEGAKRFTHNIDPYQKLKSGPIHRQRIAEARQKATAGYSPRFEIIPVSSDFHIDLLRFYIDHLLAQGIQYTRRVYDPNTRIKNSNGSFVWDFWNNEVLQDNLVILFQNLKRVYQLLIERHFPELSAELDLFRDGNLILYCLSFEHRRHAGPQLEYYKLNSRAKLENNIRFYTNADRPFSRESLMGANGWTMRIGGKVYDLRAGGGEGLTFMFNPLPMHTFVRKLINDRIAELLKKKIAHPNN